MPLSALFSPVRSRDEYELISPHNITPLSPLRSGSKTFVEKLRYTVRLLRHKRTLYILCGLLGTYCVYILSSGIPPSFSDIRDYERQLPQHTWDSRGKEDGRKYFRVSDPNRGRGFNNVIIEGLMMSYISYVSNRTFVFNDYIWANHPLPYTIYENALRPSRIPLNAFISGPTAGGPIPNSTYRAVSSDYYDTICPPGDRYQLDTKDAPGVNSDGITLVKWWRDQLESTPDRCVEARKPVLDLFFFGADRLLPFWDGFRQSPIIQEYSWSFLVYSAFARNFYLFDTMPKSSIDTKAIIDGLVAIHIRRGDYEQHCYTLFNERAPYMGVNSLPELLDRFDPPQDKDELLKYYLARCLPTTKDVAQRLRSLRRDNPGLKKVYVLTNAGKLWISQLTDVLIDDGWSDVKSTYDLHLDAQQYWVSHGVDSLIGEKAEVFVGNGFSSLSANIIMFRLARGIDAITNRFL
ncbi:hypothetical protein BDQ17DRAFT_1401236 [Cyathus striatus]|nr:hypothetical protein BDQ17DRAFT_1401236 [Cyathus striatus]